MTTEPIPNRRVALAAAALAAGGVLFALYQVLRPFTDTAQTMASTAWVLSHSLAIAGFVLICLGLHAPPALLRRSAAEPVAATALVLAWLGTGPTLAYYGAETFGLWVIARRAVRDSDPSLLELATDFHQAPLPTVVFAVGLLLLGGAGVLTAVAVWRLGALGRWSATALAAGLLLLIPQFFAPQPVRMVHGALLALGCLGLAASLLRARGATGRATPPFRD